MSAPSLGTVALGFGAFLVLFGVVMVGVGIATRRASSREAVTPGLYGVVGRMGSGKTLLAVSRALEAVEAGRPVYANFQLSGANLVESWEDVLRVPHRRSSPGARACCDGSGEHSDGGSLVIVDEAQLWWPSTAWQAPAEVRAWLAQLRKLGVTMFWTSQHISHPGKRLVQLSFGVWTCNRLRQVHEYRLYAPGDVGRRGAVSLATMRVRRTDRLMAAYDTWETVSPACTWERGSPSPARGTSAGAGTGIPVRSYYVP